LIVKHLVSFTGLRIVVCGAVLFNALPAMAGNITTYTTSLQSGNMCTGCGPFGTVSVSTVLGQPDEISVTLTLDPGEVFADTGAGAALLFDIAGNPHLSLVSVMPSGYSFHQVTTHADGSGDWNTYISCDICGNATSPPTESGPLTFVLASTSALTPSSFVTNGKYLFASDLGVPNGTGGYFTGDVVTKNPLTPVPLPASLWLLICGAVGLAATRLLRIG
jgi:hypothetical protein